MKSIQVWHLKAEFSKILSQIEKNGEKFVIEYGRSHKKIAMLIPYDESLEDQTPRVFGILKNQASFTLSEDFGMTDDEFLGHV